MNKCKMCYLVGKNVFCRMDDKRVENERYHQYCEKNNIQQCPAYKYYWQKYKELMEK